MEMNASKRAAVMTERREIEIGRILRLRPTGLALRVLHFKSEGRNVKLDGTSCGVPVQLEISAFGFEVQDSFNFKLLDFKLPSHHLRLTP
jgi:hypothetical protein